MMPRPTFVEIESFALDNLLECCVNMEELSRTGVLPAGKFRDLFNMIEESGFGTLQTARGLISDLAVRLVSKMPSETFSEVAPGAIPPSIQEMKAQQRPCGHQ
jgi:hypothetical protein